MIESKERGCLVTMMAYAQEASAFAVVLEGIRAGRESMKIVTGEFLIGS
jgi:hypothetical protein